MATSILDHISVHQHAADIGCNVPEGIALLPNNFASARAPADFLQPSEAATVKALFRNYDIPLDDLIPVSVKTSYIQNNSAEWIAPTLFIGSALMTQNAALVGIALNVLSNYITDFFKGIPGSHNVKLDIVVEKKGDRSCKTIRYEGAVSGLNNLPDIIKKISDE